MRPSGRDTGQLRDVMTLAHELGHGVHDVLAARNHLFDYHPVLPMAETASTFGEMLVFDRLQRTLDGNDRTKNIRMSIGQIQRQQTADGTPHKYRLLKLKRLGQSEGDTA